MSFGRRWSNLNPYELHKTLINEYLLTRKDREAVFKRDTSKDKRDIDVIRENHQFLWEDEEGTSNLSWERKLAKKYYDKLYKEYCVGDLSRYKENKIGLRWRTEQELISGKGQFSCGSKKCSEKEDLKTWEVNFGYIEHGVKKNALVKLRLCPDCSYKLNYHHKKKEVKRLKSQKSKFKLKDISSSSESIRKRKSEGKRENKVKEEVDLETDSTKEASQETSDSDIWKSNPNRADEEERKTREEEFDEYLEQLFL